MFKQRCFRLLLLASAIATSLSAAAYDFEWAGIYYNITGNNTVEVTRSDNYNNTYSGSVSIPETFTANGEYFVTKIGENAFAGSAVTSVSMPEGITSIGQYAFSGCQNLESVTLPETLTTLGSEAFYGCKNLESVALPESLTTLGGSAFKSCSSLKAVKIPSKVTAIPDQCFYGCSSLESVTIPEGVTAIGYDAFSGCKFNALTLPSTITSIGGGAFSNNFNLQSIICNATTPPVLDDYAFSSTTDKDIKVPLSSIVAYRQAEGWKNFTNYYGEEVASDGITYRINEKEAVVAAAEAILTEANILSSVEFEGNQYPVIKINSSVFSDNINLTAVTLPEGLVEIGTYAFRECQNLASVTLPELLTTLGHNAFYQCTNLESVKIPNTVTSIKHRAFQYCCNLESIIIPSSVNSIGISAFSECKALKDIYCQAVNVPETHSSAFNNSPIENMTLYVPGESMNAYKTTAPWSGFGKFQTLTTGIEKTETAAKPMITTADGQIAVSGLSGNATIQVLSLDGKLLDSTNATDGIATLNAQPGEVVIVKVGTESYKVVVR